MEGQGEVSAAQAARLMDVLGLTEEELCTVLEAEPLTLLSGQLEHRPELPILLNLLADSLDRVGPGALRRWVRTGYDGQRPIDALLGRDFAGFEAALDDLAARGFVIRGGGRG